MSRPDKSRCDVCGADIGEAENRIGCPVCSDRYFETIRKSYEHCLQRFSDTFAGAAMLNLEMAQEAAKTAHGMTERLLGMERGLQRQYPSAYYMVTSYQFLRNLYLENWLENMLAGYKAFAGAFKAWDSVFGQNIVSWADMAGGLVRRMDGGITPGLSDMDRNLIRLASDANRAYDRYRKESKPQRQAAHQAG